MKKIAILYTGGTIGMVSGAHGLAPDPDFPKRAASGLPNTMRFDWHRAETLIDSAAVTPHHWALWLTQARQYLADYDGLLILHGTDTLAYTAALFALVFAESAKPIILTGAQKAWDEKDSDAPHNLYRAAMLFDSAFRGCGIVFTDTLFDPADCRKVSTEAKQGFAAVYHSPLGHFQQNQWRLLRPAAYTPLPSTFDTINPDLKIAACLLMPGFSLDTVTQILNSNQCNALILHSYGHGNTPDDPDFLAAVRSFCRQGKILLNLSQVWQGNASSRYAQNHALHAAGAINGGKITPEQALAKLTVALSARLTGDELRRYITGL